MADRRLNKVAFGLTVLSGLLLAGAVIVSIMYGVLSLAGQVRSPIFVSRVRTCCCGGHKLEAAVELARCGKKTHETSYAMNVLNV